MKEIEFSDFCNYLKKHRRQGILQIAYKQVHFFLQGRENEGIIILKGCSLFTHNTKMLDIW